MVRTTVTVAFVLGSALLINACGSKQPEDSKESLTKDPERLKAVMAQCRSGDKTRDDRMCAAAAAAYNQRFFDRKSVEGDTTTSGAAATTAAPKP